MIGLASERVAANEPVAPSPAVMLIPTRWWDRRFLLQAGVVQRTNACVRVVDPSW